MKRQRINDMEAQLEAFISDHNGGDVIGKLLNMSAKLDEDDMQFLGSLTSSDPFDRRMSDCRETINALIDIKSTKKPISEVTLDLKRYLGRECSLSRESVAIITSNICAEALENYIHGFKYKSEKTHFLHYGLENHKELKSLTGAMKELVSRNRFDIANFRWKYFQMKKIPLEILWHFHCTDLILFTNYIYNIIDKKGTVDFIKDSMVELLCSFSYGSKDGSCKINEFDMDFDVPGTSKMMHERPSKSPDIHDDNTGIKEEDGSLQIRKEMAMDLLTSLLCTAQNSNSDSELVRNNAKSCEEILEDIVNMVVTNILADALDTVNQRVPDNYLLPLLKVPTVSTDILQSFLTSHLSVILAYEPLIDSKTAISKQGDWTYSKSPSGVTPLMEAVLTGLSESSLSVIKDVIQKEEINWHLVLISVSVYLKCIPESGKHLKSLIDWLLSKAFLNQSRNLLTAALLIARQCCLEGCIPSFSSYIAWFGMTFGPESPWASKNPATPHIFEFFIQFLTDIVPYEPSSCLRVHVNKAPAGPPSTHSLLMDYITLAKTRLKDLNEAPGFSIFGPELSTEQDIEYAIKHFEKHNGEIAQTLLDAFLFRRQHFEQEFLEKLLRPRIMLSTPDSKAKFIAKLHSMGKISHAVFSKYEELCFAERTAVEEAAFGGSPKIMEISLDPMEEFLNSINDYLESINGLSSFLESQRMEEKVETGLPPAINSALRKVSCSLDSLLGNKEGKKIAANRPIQIDEITSISCANDNLSQIVDALLDIYFRSQSLNSYIFSQTFLELFHPYYKLKVLLMHNLHKYCNGEKALSRNKFKAVVALVHSTEHMRYSIDMDVQHNNQDVSFASFLSETFPMHTAQEMDNCYRFAADYLHYAEAHHLNQKKTVSGEQFKTVPLAIMKKYLYLLHRYSFAENSHLTGMEKYQPGEAYPEIWSAVLNKAKMSFKEWLNQEASVKPFGDFLVSRHEYLLNMLTSRPIFDASNIIHLATEIIHTISAMDSTQNNHSAKNSAITYQCWNHFHRDIMQVLSTLLETFPLVGFNNTHSWIIDEWMKLGSSEKSGNFFRIVSALPPWLLYCNARCDVPPKSAVKAVANFVNSYLKNVLSNDNGFLHAALVRHLLTGLNVAVGQDRTSGFHLFNVLFESCPALVLASRVHASIVLPIIQKFNVDNPPSVGATKHLLLTLPVIKSGTSQVHIMSRGENLIQDWEMALDAWLQNKSIASLQPNYHKWEFFYNILKLGTQLQNGIAYYKFESDSLLFQYTNEICSHNITTALMTELEHDFSVINTLDVLACKQVLPFCGLSEMSQNLLSVAGLLFLLFYNTVKEVETNAFVTSVSNATLVCKVMLSCFSNWMKSEPPIHFISSESANVKKQIQSPLTDPQLLLGARNSLYSVLSAITNKHKVIIPSIYSVNIGDVVIQSIFLNVVHKTQ